MNDLRCDVCGEMYDSLGGKAQHGPCAIAQQRARRVRLLARQLYLRETLAKARATNGRWWASPVEEFTKLRTQCYAAAEAFYADADVKPIRKE